MNSVKIAVGSKNPVKVKSVESGFCQWLPGHAVTVTGYDVDSGVSDQPMSSTETQQGALGRVDALRSQARADGLAPDFFVGIEGGIEIIDDQYFASAWVVISDHQGRLGSAKSGLFPLPPEIKRLVDSGLELGLANDQVFSESNSKHAGGAVGSLTEGAVTRQSLYEHAMALALIPFRQPGLFGA